ncbi:MAG: glucosyltransferase domain-containing protein [Oscillospiraceae bacterium]|jgi:hypothetical protein|nr:glucosyltransferase domain-containing protein [Oscillospiraceae bacterium]
MKSDGNGFQLADISGKTAGKFRSQPVFPQNGDALSFRVFCASNKLMFAVLGGFTMLAYGFKMFNYAPFIDTGAFINNPDIYDGWFGINRYGAVFTKWVFGLLRPEPASVYMVSAGMLLVGGAVWNWLFCRLRRGERTPFWQNWIFPCLFVTAPCLFEILHFECLTFEIAFGLLLLGFALTLLSGWVTDGGSNLRPGLAVLLFVWIFSIYQAFVPLAFAGILACFILICRFLGERENQTPKGLAVQILLRFAAPYMMGFLIYNLAGWLVRLILRIPAGGYTDSMVMWKVRPFIACVLSVGKYILDVLTGQGSLYNMIFPLSVLCLLAFALKKSLKGNKTAYCPWIWLAVLALCASPFLLPFLLGGALMARAQLTLPFVAAFGFYLFAAEVTTFFKKQYAPAVLLAVCMFLSFRQGTVVSRLAYTDDMVYQQEVMLTTQITNRIGELGLGQIPSEPVVTVGTITPILTRSMVTGDTTPGSHYEWDWQSEGGTAGRVRELWGMQGIFYTTPGTEQIRRSAVLAAGLPVWPADGSVALIEGIIIVNLGEQ